MLPTPVRGDSSQFQAKFVERAVTKFTADSTFPKAKY